MFALTKNRLSASRMQLGKKRLSLYVSVYLSTCLSVLLLLCHVCFYLDVCPHKEPPDSLKNATGEEEVVEDSETNEQPVEDAGKLLGQQQGDDRDAVGEEPRDADCNLKE
jgi:hypothetical protein